MKSIELDNFEIPFKNDNDVESPYGYVCSQLSGDEPVAENPLGPSFVPESFSLVDVMPKVEDQGQTPRCCAFALLSICDYIYNANCSHIMKMSNWDASTVDKTTAKTFGVNEIYENCKVQGGMMPISGIKYLANKGIRKADGEVFKIPQFAKVPNFEVMKYCIMVNGPVLLGMKCYQDAINGSHEFWNPRAGEYVGGHAVVAVGYTQKGFIIRNSWGSRWMNKGYTIIPTQGMIDSVLEAWTPLFF